MKFQIRLTGHLMPGADQEQAADKLARAFKIDRAKAVALLDGKPRVIKKNLEQSKAGQYAAALGKMGIAAQAMPMVHAPAPAARKPVAADKSESKTVIREAFKAADDAVPPPSEQTEGGDSSWRNDGGWDYRLEGQPDFAFLSVKVPANQTMRVEASAMATMDTHLSMKTKLGGGFKRFISGESIFLNEFTADGGEAEIGIAPAAPGDMAHHYLDGSAPLYLQNSAFVAATGEVQVETKWQGLAKGFFSGEGLFLIRAVGRGDLWFNTFGALIEQPVDGEYVVDNGHIVAFTEGLEYKMTKLGGYKSFFLSGEGLVCRFTGQGTVWLQSRHPSPFAGWAARFRPVKKRG